MSLATDKYFYYQIGKPEEKADYGDLYFFSQAILVIEGRLNGIVAGNSALIPNTLPSGQILVGNASNVATAVAMSGEATIINTGAVTLSNAAVIGKVLTGFVVGANTPIVAADSILQAFGKTQGQISAIVAAGGITSLSGQTGAVQTFVNDTNITVVSAANAHTLTWAGALADARIASAATWNAKLTSVLPSANIFVGNAGNVATAAAMSGDATISNTGVVTVAAYKTVEDEGIAVTQRSTINFVGAGVTAADSGGKTVVTIPGGAGVPALTTTEIAFGDGANLMTSSPNFIRTTAKITITPDGTGTLGGLYLTRGDVVNQYIVLHENVASPNSAYLTFKSSGGNAIAMGAIFAAGAPVSYVFTDPSGVPLNTIDATTGANTLLNLAGVGTRMVTATAAGVLGAAAIPTNTTIANDPNWVALGDTPYGTGAATGAILAGHTNADKRFYSQTGTGVISAVPAWVRLDAADINSGTLPANRGGTGISNNAASTITISGAFATTLTVTGATGVTLPTSGTLATTADIAAAKKGFVTFSSGTFNPGDGLTYYIGCFAALAPTNTAGLRGFNPPVACTMVSISLNIFIGAVNGGAETVSMNIRKNNATDTNLTTTMTLNGGANSQNLFFYSGLSVAFNGTSDYWELKMICPNPWTNPTGVFISGTAYFE